MNNWKTTAENILTDSPVIPVIVINEIEHVFLWQRHWLLVEFVFWK